MTKDSDSKRSIKSLAIPAFCAILFLLLEIALGQYFYESLKRDFREEFLRELQRGVCKEEFRQLLYDGELLESEAFKTLLVNNNERYLSLQKKVLQSNDIVRRVQRSIRVPLPVLIPHVKPPVIHNPFKPPIIYPFKPTGFLNLFKPKLVNMPGLPGLPGPPGPRGPPGLKGQKGDHGMKGLKGSTGEKGSLGHKGNSTEKCQKGDKGAPGGKGDKGKQGGDGRDSAKGDKGDPGEQEPIGHKGISCGCDEVKSTNESDAILIKKFGNKLYPGFDIKSSERMLSSVGKPEYYGSFEYPQSSYMIDPNPLDDEDSQKIWSTSKNSSTLLQFNNIESLEKNEPAETHKLDIGFDGNANVIYKGVFYYKINNTKPSIAKYNLKTKKTDSLDVDELLSHKIESLYKSEFNYFDFSVDENGLWVIFSTPYSENTAVAKIDEDTLMAQYVWEFNIKNRKFIDMFIASGILYTMEHTSNGEVQISLAINLSSHNVIRLNLDGILQTGGISMATFNHKLKKILIVDDDKRFGYPVSFDDKGIIVQPE